MLKLNASRLGQRVFTNPSDFLPLRSWLWRSYLRSALIPLLVIELSFLAIFWFSSEATYQRNAEAVRIVSDSYLGQVASSEASAIGVRLAGVASQTQLFAAQTQRALDGNYTPPQSEKARYVRGRDGAFFTNRDNGTTASFYSGAMPVGPAQIGKVWKLAALDPLMMDIKNGSEIIDSIYFNSFDSYNRIYPYFDVRKQYPARMNIPSFNFYYEADGKHNPDRRPVWTDAYIDPAGHGWMVSSIAPVWRGDKLEGVVGLDITLKSAIDRLLHRKLPWNAYTMLVDRQGRILAMPKAAEADFGVRELTDVRGYTNVESDTFKPDAYDLGRRRDTQALSAALKSAREGEVTLDFDGPHIARFTTIDGPGWHLVVIAPSREILAEADALRAASRKLGLAMMVGLLIFYGLFFWWLADRARAMSRRVAAPVNEIADLLGMIGQGRYRHKFDGSPIAELNQLGHQLVDTGAKLGEAYRHILEQEEVVKAALDQQKQINEEQIRFTRVMSHELRTPLAVIDSAAQIIDRKAETLRPYELRSRAERMRNAVQRITNLLERLATSQSNSQCNDEIVDGLPCELAGLVQAAARAIMPSEQLKFELQSGILTMHPALVRRCVRVVTENCLKYAGADCEVRVGLTMIDECAVITIEDNGAGIPGDELDSVGRRYFRGSTAVGMQGSGIGLHDARLLLESIGGTLTIASSTRGTKVTLIISVETASSS